MANLCRLLILALVCAIFGRRVEATLSAIFVRAVNSGLDLEILLDNLLSLDSQASNLLRVCLHALSF